VIFADFPPKWGGWQGSKAAYESLKITKNMTKLATSVVPSRMVGRSAIRSSADSSSRTVTSSVITPSEILRLLQSE
jgi:hypothetical protein